MPRDADDILVLHDPQSLVSEKQHEAVEKDSSDLPALDHDFCHSDLFLLSLSTSLQSRHPCFQPGDPVDELLVLLLWL